MSRHWYLVMLAVVVTCGIGTRFSSDRDDRPIARSGASQKQATFTRSPQESVVPAPAKPLDDVRKAERSRRAVRPADDRWRGDYLSYEHVLKKGDTVRPRPVEPMPPTYCHSIEIVPIRGGEMAGLYGIHEPTVRLFEMQSGFGFTRMELFKNERGDYVASRDIERVELVSLLTDDEPSVYVLEQIATPPLARQAKRRPLDEFERLGLDALRRGEELVWTREAPTRMLGAICAKASCLHCHANARDGDLLGAFTYYLKVPVDRLNRRKSDGARFPEPDPETKRILDRLEARIDLDFEKTPLGDVLTFIKSANRRGPNDREISIYVDQVSLVEEAEKTLASPVSFTSKGEPLKISLERLLKSMSLTYMVRDGFMMITSR